MNFHRIFLLIHFVGLLVSSMANPEVQRSESFDTVWNSAPYAFHEAESFFLNQIHKKQDSTLLKILIAETEKAEQKANFPQAFKGNFLTGVYFSKKHKWEEAQQKLEHSVRFSSGHDDKAIALFYLAKLKVDQRKYLEALEFIRQAKIQIYNQQFTELENELLLAETYCYSMLLNVDAATSRLKNLQKTINDYTPAFQARVTMMEGFVALRQNHLLQAMIAFKKAINISSTDTITETYANTLKFIGELLTEQKNHKKAEEYYTQSARIFKTLTMEDQLAGVYCLIGYSKLKSQQPDESILYFQQALTRFEQYFDYYGMCLVYNHIAEFYLTKKQTEKVLPALWKANEFDKQYSDQWLYLVTNLNFARYYAHIHNYDSAIYYGNKAISYSKNREFSPKVQETYLLLSSVYYMTGAFKQAADALQMAQKINETHESFEQSTELKLHQFDLEKQKQEHTIQSLTQERNKQDKLLINNQLLLGKQKTIILFIGSVLFMISLLALLLLVFIVQKRKDQKKLEIRNRQIAQQKEEIEVQQQYLIEINHELEKLSIVARETDNGIKVMNEVGRVIWVNEGYVKMHGYNIDDLQQIEHADLVGEQANIDVRHLVSVWYGDKKPITYESLNKTKWGQEIWVQTTLTPILDANGRIDRMIAIESDITRIKLAEKEIIAKNHDITSSIYYAKRIQEAMMTPFYLLTKHFPESFYFHLPKSIVSGDFYWVTHRYDRLIVVCADSTGHGVPGAFMSLIGISFLNKIVNEMGFVSPAVILNNLRTSIIDHLHQDTGGHIAGDGLDMSIISIDLKSRQLEYAGAMNPVIILRNSDVIELKPDRMPVGFFDNEDRPFSSTQLTLQVGDQIFMYTDGYYDQFGGEHGSKMKGQKFRKILSECAQKPIVDQKQIIEDQFHQWRGPHAQVDDVLVLGIQVN